MKRNISIIIGIIVVLVIIVLSQKKTATAPSNVQSSSTQPTTVQVVNSSTNKPTTNYVAPKSSTVSYESYAKSLSEAKNKCNETARTQYSKLYNALESSSFQSYFNETTGVCYSKIVGNSRAEYATTSLAIMVFRDVQKNTNLMECTNPKGTSNASADWNCTDRISGKTISVAEFNGQIYKYTVK